MNLIIENPGPRLTAEDLTEFESIFGIKLPESYRSFLLEYNGWQPTPDCIDIPNAPGSPTDIQVFFGLGRTIQSSDLRWVVETYGELVSSGVFPIACDSGGNLFGIQNISDLDCNVVYVDKYDPLWPRYPIAPDFDQFMEQIRSFE